MNIILIFIIAVSLSMDAFSLSLAYGTINIRKREINILSIIVGMYHFIMPILGMILGSCINNFLNISENIIMLIVFCLIGLNMILDIRKKEEVKHMKISEMFLFGFAVSIDSFSIGIGLNNISNNFIFSSIIFSITSLIFTYSGLRLGQKLNLLFGKLSTLIGGITLIIMGIYYGLRI